MSNTKPIILQAVLTRNLMSKRPVTKADLFSSPASFLAFGFGTGLSPVAPGTFGSLPGLLIVLALSPVSLISYLVITLIACVAGVWICGVASSQLGTHDHGGIVWDEIVGIMVTMIAVPLSPLTLIAGFCLFRLFDIWKPWPIGWVDKKVQGGFGIMIDDVIAGVAACICLHLIVYLMPVIV